MARENRLPDLPTALLGQQNKINFIFSSVLSQIQNAALRYQGFQQFMPAAQAVAKLGQVYQPALEALDRFDFEKMLENEARAANMSELSIREDDDVQAIRQQRAQQQAAAAQAAQQEAQAETAKTGAEAQRAAAQAQQAQRSVA
jgi:hypothetical protein